MKFNKIFWATSIFVFLVCFSDVQILTAQEKEISGIELSFDQDNFTDYLRSGDNTDNNYTVAMRLAFYGAYANHDYLGAPWIRKRVDGVLLDNLLFNQGFNEDEESYFSDRNRWRRGRNIIDPDADEW